MNAVLKKADRLFACGRGGEGFEVLRRLSIEQFGQLLLDVPERFAALRAALPEMPSEKIQRDWTGCSGAPLLAQTCAFVRSVESAFERLCRRPLRDATILDYGCGWGRIMRLMYRFSAPGRVYGIDPWSASLAICRSTGVLGTLAPCDYVPRELPFEGVTFDLVYAFSVFTHLSEKTAHAVLAAIRRRISRNGLLAVTIRPVEYWDVNPWFPPGTNAATMRARHADQGFAFVPHSDHEPIGGDVTYGEASIAVDYVRRNWEGWQLAGHEANRVDPYQLVLFLRPQ